MKCRKTTKNIQQKQKNTFLNKIYKYFYLNIKTVFV